MLETFESFDVCADEIKKKILRDGIWQPFTERIKNLEKSQDKLWELYYLNGNLENKRAILEDLISLQPVIADWYTASKKIIEHDVSSGV